MAQLTVSQFDRSIGKRIQLRRKELGWTAEQLAEKIDISYQQLTRYERGDNKINVSHLIQLSYIMKTPLSWFFLDCYPDLQLNNDELKARWDFHWQQFDDNQKQIAVRFLDQLCQFKQRS